MSGPTLVVGLGASGVAAAELLLDQGQAVRISEQGPYPDDPSVDALVEAGAELLVGGHVPEHLNDVELAVVSPGVPEHAPVIGWLRDAGIAIWSEPELAARATQAPYLAVTGTNGKTTTTEMLAACLQAEGIDAVACGNIGHPFSRAVRGGHQAYAVEMSSFQLRFTQAFHPRVSVLLNIAEDHLDWHGGMDAYVAAKSRIFAQQGAGDTHVGNRDDAMAAAVSIGAPCRQAWFSLGPPMEPGDTGYDGDDLHALGSDGAFLQLGVPTGSHRGFRADAAAAGAAALAYGVAPDAVAEGLAQVTPGAHRGVEVAQVDGVAYVDDSKATNPHAALAALDGRTDVVLIAGGRSKGVDLSPLLDATGALRAVIAIGEASPELSALFAGRVPVQAADSMEDAVRAASAVAAEGSTVLLAPACASQDMFLDYRERGECFAAAARALEVVAHG